MNHDESKALFTQLGRMEEKLDNLSDLKVDVQANTKFRFYSTAFIILFVGFVGVVYKMDRLAAKVVQEPAKISKVIK